MDYSDILLSLQLQNKQCALKEFEIRVIYKNSEARSDRNKNYEVSKI
jgi:hypothetical protein